MSEHDRIMRALEYRFAPMLAHIRSDATRQASMALHNATPQQLADARDDYMRNEREMYVRQKRGEL